VHPGITSSAAHPGATSPRGKSSALEMQKEASVLHADPHPRSVAVRSRTTGWVLSWGADLCGWGRALTLPSPKAIGDRYFSVSYAVFLEAGSFPAASLHLKLCHIQWT